MCVFRVLKTDNHYILYGENLMLNKHLVATTHPKAKEKNIVYWGKYRITVLQERLFRLERSNNKKFRDEATQSVWFRDMPEQNFNVINDGDTLTISTKQCALILKEKREDCRVQLNNEFIKINNEGNLKGTARTLDRYDGDVFVGVQNKKASEMQEIVKIEIENGVCSRKGIAVFDDANSLTLGSDGEIKPICGDGFDEYIFAYGNDYRAAVKALYMICGSTPLIPRFALGNWWSRYHIYTDKEYLRLLNSFEEQNIPFTVATIDMDWHYSKQMEEDLHITEKGRNTEFCGGNNGWTGYTWNKRLFPDYKEFLRKIKEKNLKITLNLHPAGGIRWWEDCYNDVAKAMGVDAENGEWVKFDIANTDFINTYFSKIHKPFENDGVSFWWIDWQQGVNSGMDGLDPLWSLNHYHYLDNASNHSAPLILSRYAGIGSHRYPLGFSGDTHISWATLNYLPQFTSTASNIGYTWWSHDIGGHMFGEKNDEMYLRHIQYGVFSPINRLHCSSAEVCTKEPWAYGNGTGELARKWLRFRHKLIPYLYTASYRTHKDGVALVEPLYYEWKNDAAYRYTNEYLYGGELLVAPITTPAQQDGYSRINVWLPEGKWIDIFTGSEYIVDKDGKEITLLRILETVPVFIKAGGILPLSADEGNSINNPKTLEVLVWEGNGEYTLYEDGRVNEVTDELFTTFKTAYEEHNGVAKQTLTISMHGEESVIPKDRTYKIRFKDISDGEISVFAGNKKIKTESLLTYCAGVDFSINTCKEYRVEVSYKKQSQLDKLKAYARKTLICTEGNISNKENLWKKIAKVQSVEEYVNTVNSTENVSNTVKQCLKVVL